MSEQRGEVTSRLVGLMGGTFDPIHYGHLITAEEVREIFGLEKLLFIPAYLPPHKDKGKVSSSLHRYHMVVLATLDNEHFAVSPIELLSKGNSYTIDTITKLKGLLPVNCSLFFITGIDSFMEIDTWKEPMKLLESCHFIINSRAGYDLSVIKETLPPSLVDKVVTITPENPFRADLLSTPEAREWRTFIFLVETTPVGIASTEIRQRVKENRTIKYLVPESVERYIIKKRLYR
ncbi:nicotinic acid mononucleotide adenylyltransferase [bacterium (candidate division B38) B3_B38]|nr:MAG: nicotinic acid mononucleotide adenylyltransferase [bacterium (candidate division B38) B3_B38]